MGPSSGSGTLRGGVAWSSVSYDLVCANCSGLVELGRCSVCRASRERLRASRTLPAGWLLLAAALVAVLALVAHL